MRLVRQRGLVIGRDAAAAGYEIDAQALQQADAAAVMGATCLGVAGLDAADVLGSALQALTPGLRLQRGGFDGVVGGATYLLEGQDFFPPPPVLRPPASAVALPATGG